VLRSKEGTAMMGSLKVYEAGRQCIEVRRLLQAEKLEVMLARAHAQAHGTQEAVDTVESLLQLGLTGFEASMEQFERADRSLARLRANAIARPPELNYDPDVTDAAFQLLRERYYDNRGKDMAKLLRVVDVDRSNATFANGGPVTNRVKKDPLQGLDYEFDVVGLPSSPMGFSVLRYRQPTKSSPLTPVRGVQAEQLGVKVEVSTSKEDADSRLLDFIFETPTLQVSITKQSGSTQIPKIYRPPISPPPLLESANGRAAEEDCSPSKHLLSPFQVLSCMRISRTQNAGTERARGERVVAPLCATRSFRPRTPSDTLGHPFPTVSRSRNLRSTNLRWQVE